MPLTRTEVAELEAQIDDEQLSEVRFGRSSFLRNAGIALFGLTAGVLMAQDDAEAAPPGCSGAPTCRRCRGSRCTSSRCRGPAPTCGGSPCWRIRRGCRVYKCCDWDTGRPGGSDFCICRGFVGYAC